MSKTPASKRPHTEVQQSPSPTAVNPNSSSDVVSNNANNMDKIKSPTNRMYIENLLRDMVQPLQNQIGQLRQQLEEEQSHRIKLQDKLLKLEAHSRRSNVIIKGLSEVRGESYVDCRNKVLNVLAASGINLHPRSIDRAHRLGPVHSNSKYPRPMIVKFLHSQDREWVIEHGTLIRQKTNCIVSEDFPDEIKENRKLLEPIATAAKFQKQSVKLSVDKLIINKKVYTVNNLDKLPESLNPEKVSTPTRGNKTAFFSKQSPLSNMHPSVMTVGKTKFSSNEQFYVYSKAKRFHDDEAAADVLKMTDPVAIKRRGKNIANYDNKIWKDDRVGVMKTGLLHKFRQNSHLKNFLLQTENNILIEASAHDKFWGCGLSLHNRKLWDHNSWLGKAENKLGELLVEVRQLLRHENDNEK